MQASKNLVSAPIRRCRKAQCTIAFVVWKRWRKASKNYYARVMSAVLPFRIGNGSNATRAIDAASIVYATCVVDSICVADAACVVGRFAPKMRPALRMRPASRNDLHRRCDFDFVEKDPRMWSFPRQKYRMIKNSAYFLQKFPGQKLIGITA